MGNRRQATKEWRGLALSVMLNVVLLVCVLLSKWLVRSRAVESPAPHMTTGSEVQTSGSVALTTKAAPFSWSQIEADDYPTYIRNLRTIGCPEQTIRDIVTADIAASYEAKRQELRAARSPSDSPSGGSIPAAGQAELQMALTALTGEQNALLNELLPRPKPSFEATGARVSLAQGTPRSPLPTPGQFGIAPPSGMNPAGVSEPAAGTPQAASSALTQAGDSAASSPVSRDAMAGNAVPAATPYVTPTPPTYHGSTPANTPAPRRSLFTLEEQQYRAKWGWQAFYYEH